MSKKLPLIIISLLFLVFSFSFLVFLWWSWAVQARSPKTEAEFTTFVISKGESTDSIAQRLHQEGLIRSPLAFKIILYQEMLAGKIQAGSFKLNPSLTPKEIGQSLTHGTTDLWITIPEGWRSEEIIQRLEKELQKDFSKDLEKFVSNEGYLFPDTYLFPKESTSDLIINEMKDNFARKFPPGLVEEAEKNSLSQEQVVILASLVEREVKHNEDRPLVAGILVKRFFNDWPLQVDATIQYAKANNQRLSTNDQIDWWPKVSPSDLETDSPHNTYKYPGLPPGPICNPGLASLKAVIYPQDSPYWYYLSDSSANIHYAETIDQHNANITKYLQ